MLWKAVKDVLEIADHNIGAIEQELFLSRTNMTTKQGLQVVWSGNANLRTGGER
jgi:hypothetical protein